MGQLRSFTASAARPLPVIILADTSGSMGANGKIEALNSALADLIRSFAEEEGGRAEIHVAVITFGGAAQIHLPVTPAQGASLSPFAANGGTPMGAAFELATTLLQDRESIPSRTYTPSIVLVSDGMPNDSWESPLTELLDDPRARKAQRFALGIGKDADPTVLRRFLDDPEGQVYQAHQAGEIKSFFRWVTMSVAVRSRSANPNQAPAQALPPVDLDELL